MRNSYFFRYFVTLSASLGALAISQISQAGPAETFGYGSRSPAMGGAVGADAKDPSAVFYNPAGLAYANGFSLYAGYQRSSHYLKLNGKDNQVDPVGGTTVGFMAPGKVGPVPFAFGMSLYLPDDRVVRVRALEQQQPRWEMYDNRTQRVFLAATLAFRPFPWLSIGGGLGFMAATRIKLNIDGRVDSEDVNRSELRHEVDADLTSLRYPILGIRVEPLKKLRFGLTYRGSFRLELDIKAKINVSTEIFAINVPLLAILETLSYNQFLPQQVNAAVSYDIVPQLTLNADLTWIQWSAYESPTSRVKAIIQALNPQVPPSLLPPTPAATLVYPPNFSDRFVPRLGVEWRIPIGKAEPTRADRRERNDAKTAEDEEYLNIKHAHVLSVRGGYFFEHSPVPEQTGFTNFVDSNRHAFSFGTGIKVRNVTKIVPGDINFDMHAQISVLPERTHRKVQASDYIGDYTSKGQIWSFGATLGLVF